MIDGTYAVDIDTSVGMKKGELELVSHGTEVDAEARALGFTFNASGTTDGESFSFAGHVWVLLVSMPFTLDGKVEGDTVIATGTAGEDITFSVKGTRQ